MVRGVFTADQHGNMIQVAKAVDYAVRNNAILIFGGDITPWADPGKVDSIARQRAYLEDLLPELVAPLKGRVYLMLGNEDCKCNSDALSASSAWHVIHDRRWPLGPGVDIIGYSRVPVTPYFLKDWERIDHNPLLYEERRDGLVTHQGRWYPAAVPESRTIATDLADDHYQPNGNRTVFVSHCPPKNTMLDAAQGEKHVGSLAIRNYIETRKPLLSLHGHVHEFFANKGGWMERIGESWCMGVGNFPTSDEVIVIDFDTDKPDQAERKPL
jgi:Icc-related predicted phosphoesterase